MSNVTDSKKAFLLVSFESFNESVEQELLQIALEYEVFPYSNKDKENSFLFEAPSERVLSNFIERLEYEDLLPTDTQKIYR